MLEECLAELVTWVTRQEIYDDQLSPDSRWETRLREHTGSDGPAPLAPLYSDVYARVSELPSELEALNDMVDSAQAMLDGGRLEAASGRRRLRRRLPERS